MFAGPCIMRLLSRDLPIMADFGIFSFQKDQLYFGHEVSPPFGTGVISKARAVAFAQYCHMTKRVESLRMETPYGLGHHDTIATVFS
ncbi:hypothetical protein WQE_36330 [Paraburkholderia hospita]|uniref:Uncharacterized protein n=1 Tax=Paraburkholderia hospita TaxID=169430 RepID=A0AAN1ML93_9BURK|nr:hypothetical protein C2L64_23415 [Paraburkholderia hospita]EIM96002.1 hypothetical protein WQE_36330 [Paraburkholderia hospita]OUL87516.1 hypothetical protein CA602_13710 [Paraburkholderia hospita]